MDEQSGIILKNDRQQLAVMALSMRAKQPKRGVISGTKGYVAISNYPRAMQAEVTYTVSAHEERKEMITAEESNLALDYEVADMQQYVEQGHDDSLMTPSIGNKAFSGVISDADAKRAALELVNDPSHPSDLFV